MKLQDERFVSKTNLCDKFVHMLATDLALTDIIFAELGKHTHEAELL